MGVFGGSTAAISLEVFPGVSARRALAVIGEIGCRAAGLAVWRRELSPSYLGASGIRDLAAFLGKNGLAASWLSTGPKGRFTASATLEEDVETALAAVNMAASLRPSVVVATLGRLGSKDSAAASNACEALRTVAEAADGAGVRVALGSAQEDAAVVESVLGEISGAPLGLLFDPGAVLFAGRDPIDAVTVAPAVFAVRASDSSADEADLPPGRGRVPWRDFLAALAARDYDGYVTVEFAAKGDVVSAARAFGLIDRGGF